MSTVQCDIQWAIFHTDYFDFVNWIDWVMMELRINRQRTLQRKMLFKKVIKNAIN